MLICPECSESYPRGTPLCVNDGHMFVEVPSPEAQEPDQEQPLELLVPAGPLMNQVSSCFAHETLLTIDVIHVDGNDLPEGTCVQVLPLKLLDGNVLRLGRRTRDGNPPFQPEIDFLDVLKQYGRGKGSIVSRLHLTMHLEDGAPVIYHQREQRMTTWRRHSRSGENRVLPFNIPTRLMQRDVITLGDPRQRCVKFRISWS